MAKCSAHGSEVGTIFFMTMAKRYMSDGVVLQNYGSGWKLKGKLKAGLTPQQAFDAAKRRQEDWFETRPATKEYHRQLHNLAGMNTRWKLHAAVELMPDDPDGVWSEACDSYGDNVHADVDEIAKLCRAYIAALAECDLMKQAITA